MTPKQLKALKAKWATRLEKEGLGDIEDSKGRLKRWHSQYFQNRRSKSQPTSLTVSETRHRSGQADFQFFTSKQEFYYLCTHFLAEYPFENTLEKRFWELRCQGYSNREIEKKLKINRLRLGEIRYGLEEAMKVWKLK